jgi:LacI family transcriptional regulator
MAVRAKDLAKEIGVSEATISLVINGKSGISDSTRNRVRSEIIRLGFGYMLKGEENNEEWNEERRNDKVIGFVLFRDHGELLGSHSFLPYILTGIESTARKYGCSIHLINIEKQRIDEEIQYITKDNCLGYVIFATEMHEDSLEKFRALNLPFIVFDNEFYSENVNCVKMNNRQGILIALQELMKYGHRKIGYLSSGLNINSFHERYFCAQAIARDLHLEDMSKYFYEVGYPHEMAEKGMEKVLQNVRKEDLPTAFLCDNDLVAAGAMMAIQKAGYRIPEDFSIIGFDDRPICTLMSPKLSTIQIPRRVFGAAAVEQLVRIVKEKGEVPVTVMVNGELVERESVGPLTDY